MVTHYVQARGVFNRNSLRRAIVLWHASTTMGCGGNGSCTVSSSFVAGGNAPSGCLSCGGVGTSGALAGCACKHKHPSKPAEIQFSGGEGATPPGNRIPANFVTVPPPKKDAKRPNVPFVPGANKADVPSSQNNGGIGRFAPPIPPPAKQSNGKAPIPSRIFDAPADMPVSMPPPKESAAPVPFLPSVPMIGLASDPNPFAPYCGPDNELTPASALCRAAGDAGLSDYCRQQLLAFLGSKSSQTLGSWIAAQELCDQAALRRAVGIAEASIAAKTSAGLYDAPKFGNPFGVDGYAWKQDRVRKPNPFAPQDNGATMDWRSPSGGMPNYHRPSGLGELSDRMIDDEIDMTTPEWIAAHPDTGKAEALRRQGALSETERNAAFARGRDNPPTNYAGIISSVGQGVGGIIAGINTAVQNGENNRLRELELTFANTARSAELALRARQLELQGEIARLRASAPAAATDPAMATLIQRLEQQGAEYRSAIQRLETESQGMGTGTAVALGVGAVAVLGLGAFVLMGKRRR